MNAPTATELALLWNGWQASRRSEEPQADWHPAMLLGWQLERGRPFGPHGEIPSGSKLQFRKALARAGFIAAEDI